MSNPKLYYTNAGGDYRWETLSNWNTAANGSGSIATNVPWTDDGNGGAWYGDYDLLDTLSGGEINIGSAISEHAIGSCDISSVNNNYGGTISGGMFTGDNFSNYAEISGGTFSGGGFYSDGTISGGAFSGGGFYNGGGTISGGTFSGGNFHNYGDNYKSAQIYGGTFTGNGFNNEGGGLIYGGTFTGDGFNNDNGGTIYGGTFTENGFTNYGTISDGTFSGGGFNNYGGISGGTFTGNGFNNYNDAQIFGGTFTGGGFNNFNYAQIYGGTFTGDGFNNDLYSNIYGGTFTGGSFYNSGTISGGTFTGAFYNFGEIGGGTFTGSVQNQSYIGGGTFTGDNFSNYGEIDGGTFTGNGFHHNSGTIYGGTFEIIGFINTSTIIYQSISITSGGNPYTGVWDGQNWDCTGNWFSPSNEDGQTHTDPNDTMCRNSSVDTLGYCCGDSVPFWRFDNLSNDAKWTTLKNWNFNKNSSTWHPSVPPWTSATTAGTSLYMAPGNSQPPVLSGLILGRNQVDGFFFVTGQADATIASQVLNNGLSIINPIIGAGGLPIITTSG